MGHADHYKSPSTILRNAKRMTRFLERRVVKPTLDVPVKVQIPPNSISFADKLSTMMQQFEIKNEERKEIFARDLEIQIAKILKPFKPP